VKTRAAVLYGPERRFVVEELTLDEPKAGEVLVEMVATGMCHSDWHFATGDSPAGIPSSPDMKVQGSSRRSAPVSPISSQATM
jgi:S-(hydroxymethyl)glutathione dehydrogenase/alcohol dehydrogenase